MLIAAAVGGAAALLGAALHLFDEERAIVRAVRRLPESRIGLLRDGARAKIVGRVVTSNRALSAPLSARSCVAYRVRMHAFEDARGALAVEERRHDFVISDAAGETVWVRGAGARVIYGPEEEWQVGRVASERRVAAFLERHGRRAGARRTRYVLEEAVLAEGDIVTVVGGIRREIDSSGLSGRSHREPPVRLVFDADGGEPLSVIAGRVR